LNIVRCFFPENNSEAGNSVVMTVISRIFPRIGCDKNTVEINGGKDERITISG
jgi:hypothetical protein